MSEGRPAPSPPAARPRGWNWPYELQIGWRYTRAGRAGRRNALHLVHLRRLDARHRARRGGADHRAVGDERLPEGGARPHASRDGARRGVRRRRRGARRLACRGRTAARRHPAGASARRPSSLRRRWSRAATTCAARSCAASCRTRRRRVTDLAAQLKDTVLAQPDARRLGHRARRRTGAPARRARGRPGHHRRAGRPGHAGRRGAAAEAAHRRRHLRCRPLRVRQRRSRWSTSTTRRACSARRADRRAAAPGRPRTRRATWRASWRSSARPRARRCATGPAPTATGSTRCSSRSG